MTISVDVGFFDTWQPGYGLASVLVLIGGTNTPASVFYDQALTQPAPNPQTLIQQSANGISYGRWAQPLYTGQPYQLQINDVDTTGIMGVPLTTLQGQDASLATVVPTGASVAGKLADILARRIDVRDYGVFLGIGQQGASASTNTNTIVAAIGAAGAVGGGIVKVPAGTYQYTNFTVPQGVIVEGEGRIVTTLQSVFAGNTITITGTSSGLRHIGVDGLSQVNNSVGVYAQSQTLLVLDDVTVQRFATGVLLIGCSFSKFNDLTVLNCVTGYHVQGNSNGGPGGPAEAIFWERGFVEQCLTAGVLLESIDQVCDHHSFIDLKLEDNEGIAFKSVGARATVIGDCEFDGNTTNISVADGNPINSANTNTTIGFECRDSFFIAGGAINLSGTLANTAFRRCEFKDTTIALTSPLNNVLAQDCRQISGVAITGAATAFVLSRTYDDGASVGITTDNAAHTAWSLTLQPGQRVLMTADIVARCRNNADSAMFKIVNSATCPGATLNYINNTHAFAAGNVLTGQTSGATARITATTGPTAGAGTLTLQDIAGTFQNNEIITDNQGGSANASGGVVLNNASVGTPNNLFTQHDDTNWTAAFGAVGQTVVLNVVGDTAMNVEWVTNVKFISSAPIV